MPVGLVRDVSYAHFLAHELTANALGQKRPLWCVPADVWKAFPRTWRADYGDILMSGPHVGDGAAALTGSIMVYDDVLVNVNGCSSVYVFQASPEGGKLGPLGFNLIPDTLAKELKAAKVGVGTGVLLPSVWQGFCWRGVGTPVPALVDKLLLGLCGTHMLPS